MKLLSSTDIQLFETYCLDKRAYLCRLSFFESLALSAAARARRVQTIHKRRMEQVVPGVEELKMELTYVKLGPAY